MPRAAVSIPLLLASLSAQQVDFQRQIAPIFVTECIGCHGPDKQKADLRLDARRHAFVAGDEDYWTVIPSDPGNSELLRRLALPADDDERMPKDGDSLSAEQQDLVARWIREGASWPAAADAWIEAQLAAATLPMIRFALPPIDADARSAIDLAMQALRERGAVVQRVAADTDAIEVNLSLLRDKATDADLALLRPLAPVLVWLNVARAAIGDAGAAHLGALHQLRRLNVADTGLTDAGFAALAQLRHLEHLNAYATGLGDEGLTGLAALPALAKVYAWQTAVTGSGVDAARARLPQLAVDLGDYVEQRLAAAEQEIAARERRNRSVNEVCPVADEPVDPAHFVEHQGRRIAFCCAKCKAKFEQDPTPFLAKLPPADGKPAQGGPEPAEKPPPERPTGKRKPPGK